MSDCYVVSSKYASIFAKGLSQHQDIGELLSRFNGKIKSAKPGKYHQLHHGFTIITEEGLLVQLEQSSRIQQQPEKFDTHVQNDLSTSLQSLASSATSNQQQSLNQMYHLQQPTDKTLALQQQQIQQIQQQQMLQSQQNELNEGESQNDTQPYFGTPSQNSRQDDIDIVSARRTSQVEHLSTPISAKRRTAITPAQQTSRTAQSNNGVTSTTANPFADTSRKFLFGQTAPRQDRDSTQITPTRRAQQKSPSPVANDDQKADFSTETQTQAEDDFAAPVIAIRPGVRFEALLTPGKRHAMIASPWKGSSEVSATQTQSYNSEEVIRISQGNSGANHSTIIKRSSEGKTSMQQSFVTPSPKKRTTTRSTPQKDQNNVVQRLFTASNDSTNSQIDTESDVIEERKPTNISQCDVHDSSKSGESLIVIDESVKADKSREKMHVVTDVNERDDESEIDTQLGPIAEKGFGVEDTIQIANQFPSKEKYTLKNKNDICKEDSSKDKDSSGSQILVEDYPEIELAKIEKSREKEQRGQYICSKEVDENEGGGKEYDKPLFSPSSADESSQILVDEVISKDKKKCEPDIHDTFAECLEKTSDSSTENPKNKTDKNECTNVDNQILMQGRDIIDAKMVDDCSISETKQKTADKVIPRHTEKDASVLDESNSYSNSQILLDEDETSKKNSLPTVEYVRHQQRQNEDGKDFNEKVIDNALNKSVTCFEEMKKLLCDDGVLNADENTEQNSKRTENVIVERSHPKSHVQHQHDTTGNEKRKELETDVNENRDMTVAAVAYANSTTDESHSTRQQIELNDTADLSDVHHQADENCAGKKGSQTNEISSAIEENEYQTPVELVSTENHSSQTSVESIKPPIIDWDGVDEEECDQSQDSGRKGKRSSTNLTDVPSTPQGKKQGIRIKEELLVKRAATTLDGSVVHFQHQEDGTEFYSPNQRRQEVSVSTQSYDISAMLLEPSSGVGRKRRRVVTDDDSEDRSASKEPRLGQLTVEPLVVVGSLSKGTGSTEREAKSIDVSMEVSDTQQCENEPKSEPNVNLTPAKSDTSTKRKGNPRVKKSVSEIVTKGEKQGTRTTTSNDLPSSQVHRQRGRRASQRSSQSRSRTARTGKVAKPNVNFVILPTRLDGSELKKLEELVALLGGEIGDSDAAERCTHVIAPSILTTMKFVFALPHTPHYVTCKWVLDSLSEKKYLPEDGYEIDDPETEKKYDFVFKDALVAASKKLLFDGCLFYILTPYIMSRDTPTRDDIARLIIVAGGTIAEAPPWKARERKRKGSIKSTSEDNSVGTTEGLMESQQKQQPLFLVSDGSSGLYNSIDYRAVRRRKDVVFSPKEIVIAVLTQRMLKRPNQ